MFLLLFGILVHDTTHSLQIIKQEELRNKPAKKVLKVPAHKENLEQENVDPNIISTNPEEPIGKLPICTSSLGVVMTQNEWLIQQKADTHPTEAPKEKTITTIIPTGIYESFDMNTNLNEPL